LTCGGDALSMACATGFALAMQARRRQTGRIEFNRIDMLFWAGLFASGCSPHCLATAQLPSATQTFHVWSALGLSPVSLIVSVIAHSPAVHCRVLNQHETSPEGTAESRECHAFVPIRILRQKFSRPFGTQLLNSTIPPLKGWAIFKPPSGRQHTNCPGALCNGRQKSGQTSVAGVQARTRLASHARLTLRACIPNS